MTEPPELIEHLRTLAARFTRATVGVERALHGAGKESM